MEGYLTEFYYGKRIDIESITKSIPGAIYFAKDGGIYSGNGGVPFNHVEGAMDLISHNSLYNIQGGVNGERYHLTLAERDSIQSLSDYASKLTQNTFEQDQYFEKDVHIQGTIFSYNQNELNVGDSWINLGVADTVGQDGGIRIFEGVGTTELSRFYYDVSNDKWSTNDGLSITSKSNVGIYTASPSDSNSYGTFQVNQAGNTVGDSLAINNTSGHTLRLWVDNNNIRRIDGGSTGAHQIVLNGDGTGNVSIGGLSNSQKLNVDGNLLLNVYSATGDGRGIFLRKGFETIDQPSITLKDHTSSNSPDGLRISGYDGITFRTKAKDIVTIDINGNLDNGAFVSGFTGQGWRIDSQGNAYVKSLEVREALTVFSMQITQMDVVGGSQLLTDGIEIAGVEDKGLYWQIYFDDLGYTPFADGDVVRCQTWQGSSGSQLKYYQGIIDSQGQAQDPNYIYLIIYKDEMAGVSVPQVGDALVKVSGTIMEQSSREGGFIQIANGIVDQNSSWSSIFRIGNINGISSTAKGSNAVGYGLWSDKFVVDDTGAYLSGTIKADAGNISGFTLSDNKFSSAGFEISSAGIDESGTTAHVIISTNGINTYPSIVFKNNLGSTMVIAGNSDGDNLYNRFDFSGETRFRGGVNDTLIFENNSGDLRINNIIQHSGLDPEPNVPTGTIYYISVNGRRQLHVKS